MKVTAILLLLTTSAVFAQNTQTMNSKVILEGKCEINIPDLVIGEFIPASSGSILITKKMEVKCSKKLNYSIVVGIGVNGLALNNRRMKAMEASNTDYLRYALLYHAKVPNTILGFGDAGRVDSQGTGALQEHLFDLNLAKNQYIKAGNFTDTVTATLYY